MTKTEAIAELRHIEANTQRKETKTAVSMAITELLNSEPLKWQEVNKGDKVRYNGGTKCKYLTEGKVYTVTTAPDHHGIIKVRKDNARVENVKLIYFRGV